MFLRFDAAMNGQSLAALAPEIIVRDICEQVAEVDATTVRRANRTGQRVSDKFRTALSVRIVYNIRAYDIVRRTQIRDMIADWAGDGGWLTINTRPNQRLYVHVVNPTAVDSALKWTQDLTMTLTAYERPYWEDQLPVSVMTTDTGTLYPAGTVRDTYVECDVLNIGDSDLTALKLTCGDTHITLEGISVPTGERVVIAYTDDDLLTITAAGVSALGNRTADSSDDLMAYTRKSNVISATGDQSVSAVFTARGRWR